MTQSSKYLRFDSKEQAVELLAPLFGLDENGELNTVRKDFGCLHLIGTIEKKTGKMIDMYDTQIPEYAPVEGFYVNALMRVESPEINMMSVEVNTPDFVFAC